MNSTVFKHRVSSRLQFDAISWDCCGDKWELFLSSKFPERYDWAPTCGKCGAVGETMREVQKRVKREFSKKVFI